MRTGYLITEYIPRDRDGTPEPMPHWVCRVDHQEPGYARLSCVAKFATRAEANEFRRGAPSGR